ncbi:LysR family transcriptional regulator [Pseudomonas sp. BN505]|uniref:LysR family transcriptional regulator n=1 Tax=unclassified Pseudomonas TaxID=196821 RepID=UPI0024567B06|nr:MULTISPECIES: LysR family transcriptional regulator [unclassified Pseudomonas]MDH4842294.1 LysR family transcriptional regulator [Pseudomonas sp. BN605]MDH4855149.1 LysR family transcriptional regulator [Pseudomonas sp. BN505]
MKSEFNSSEFKDFDLNLLLILSLLVQQRSVQKVAKIMKVGSPAISMALRRLRSAFGDPLLVRSRTEMLPTPRAVSIATMVDPFLKALHSQLTSRDEFDLKSIQRTVRIAMADDLEVVLFPALLEVCLRLAPKITLLVLDSNYETADEAIQSLRADIVLTAVRCDQLVEAPHKVLYKERFVSLYDPQSVCAPIDLRTFITTPQVQVSPQGRMNGMLDSHLQEMEVSRRLVGSVTRFSTVPSVLQQVPVLCNVPKRTGGRLAKMFFLETSDLPFESPEFNIVLAWHPALNDDPLTEWFAENVVRLLDELS